MIINPKNVRLCITMLCCIVIASLAIGQEVGAQTPKLPSPVKELPPPYSQDIDGNGLTDAKEWFLAERFKPAFVIHRLNILQPEPVEILDINGNGYLDPMDLTLKIYTIRGYFVHEGPLCTVGPGLDSCVEPEQFYDEDLFGLIGTHRLRAYFDYGGAGNDNAAEWPDTYRNGRGATRPGSDFDPMVYCRFMSITSEEIVIQYWYYYPYNDGFNDHEGDWEHINVFVTNPTPESTLDESSIIKVDYFVHEDVICVGCAPQEMCQAYPAFCSAQPITMDDTHPVVFVGGTVENAFGSGHTSGASWPCLGEFPMPVFEHERIFGKGTTLHYDEVNVDIMPDFERMYNLPGGQDLTAWFLANLDKQWMRLAVFWGELESDSALGWLIGANKAGLTPSYKDDWDTHHPSHTYNWDWDEVWDERDPLVIVSTRNGTEFIPAVIDYVIIDKESWTTRGSSNAPIPDRPATLKVTVEETHIGEDGTILYFSGWKDGETSNSRSLHFSVADQELISLEAEYSSTPPAQVVLLSQTISAPDVVEFIASQTIIGPEEGAIIVNSGAGMDLHAGQSIELRPGFFAQAGSSLHCHVGGIVSKAAVSDNSASNYAGKLYLGSNQNSLSKTTDEESGGLPEPIVFSASCAPNPFNPSTTISFSIPEAGMVKVEVYDIAGRLIKVLSNSPRTSGTHSETWNGDSGGSAAASGLYFWRVSCNSGNKTGKMMLLK